MKKNNTFLLEILTQELPAIPFLKELPHILDKWRKILVDANFGTREEMGCEIFYTPRRIVIYGQKFPTYSRAHEIEFFGAPIKIAYNNGDRTQGLSNAGKSFLAKSNIEEAHLQTTMKNGQEVLYYKKLLEPVALQDCIQRILEQFLDSLDFGKAMRWGDLQKSFIRPIENICVFLGDELLDVSAFGLKSQARTKLHRDVNMDFVVVYGVEHYFETLKKHHIILDQAKRKSVILEQIEQIEQKHRVSVELDSELLKEVVAITESPHALLGRFDKKFLALPQEVIITSMKENQRYFAIYRTQAREKLFNGFVVVSNSTNIEQDIIIEGNEKVLRARLEDALFFYTNDVKNGLNSAALEQVVFINGLGSMLDKSAREKKIAMYFFEKYSDRFTDITCLQEKVERLYGIIKADLLSEMVYEFGELEGVMGYYYALKAGEDELVARAIKEQYLPKNEESSLPTNAFSAIVALAYRIDSLISIFSINKIPSGSKDPYALRRSAIGVIKILLAFDFKFDLVDDIKSINDILGYSQDLGLLEAFFIERMLHFSKINASIFTAALHARDEHGRLKREVNEIYNNALALANALKDKNLCDSLSGTFKRVCNICADIKVKGVIKTELFQNEYEKKLHTALTSFKQMEFENIFHRMQALCDLQGVLEQFFEYVLVNDENEELKNNRLALMYEIYTEFLKVGDVSKITIEK